MSGFRNGGLGLLLTIMIGLPIGDFVEGLWSIPRVVPVILQNATPYTLVLALFGAFVVWNGGIALGAPAPTPCFSSYWYQA
jgi:hypothetical protein